MAAEVPPLPPPAGHPVRPAPTFLGFPVLCPVSVTLVVLSPLFLSITEHSPFVILLPQ